MYTVPFTKIQEKIKDECPEELFTIIMRRLMMEMSEKIALDNGCAALITGESPRAGGKPDNRRDCLYRRGGKYARIQTSDRNG